LKFDVRKERGRRESGARARRNEISDHPTMFDEVTSFQNLHNAYMEGPRPGLN